MTIQLNPSINDKFDTKTLAQLRQAVFDGLGFIQPPTIGVTRKLGPLSPETTPPSLVTDIKNRLGLATPMTVVTDSLVNLRTALSNILGIATPNTVVTDTLVNIRTNIFNMLGMGAQASNPPPGVNTMLNTFINEAQQTLFRAIELDKGAASAPPVLVADSDSTTIDKNAVQLLATGLAKQHYGQDDGTNYLELSKKYLQDLASRGPPNITGILNAIVNEAQQTLFRAIELDSGITGAPSKLVSDGDLTTIDATAVLQLATGLAKAHFGKQDGTDYLAQSKKYLQDLLARNPPNITAIITAALQDAQRVVVQRYEFQSFRNVTLNAFAGPTDSTTIDAEPVFLLALANVKMMLKHEDGKLSVMAG